MSNNKKGKIKSFEIPRIEAPDCTAAAELVPRVVKVVESEPTPAEYDRELAALALTLLP